jgi:hypothetical protein
VDHRAQRQRSPLLARRVTAQPRSPGEPAAAWPCPCPSPPPPAPRNSPGCCAHRAARARVDRGRGQARASWARPRTRAGPALALPRRVPRPPRLAAAAQRGRLAGRTPASRLGESSRGDVLGVGLSRQHHRTATGKARAGTVAPQSRRVRPLRLTDADGKGPGGGPPSQIPSPAAEAAEPRVNPPRFLIPQISPIHRVLCTIE